MKNYFISVLFIFVISCFCLCQNDYKNYHLLLNKVTSKTSIDSSCFYYESAFSYAIPFSEDAFRLAIYYHKKNDISNSKKYLCKAISLGYQFKPDSSNKDEITYVQTGLNRDTNDLTNKFIISFMNENYELNRKKYLEKCKHDDSYEQLLDNENYVQSMRNLFWTGEVKDSIAYINICKYSFTPNSKLFLKFLETSTLSKRRESKRFNSSSITMLLNHCIAGFQNKSDAELFLTYIWKLVEIGEIKPREYEQAYDHYVAVHINENASYFGSRTTRDENGKRISYPLLDPKNVEKLRAEAWLLPLITYNQMIGLELPINYEK